VTRLVPMPIPWRRGSWPTEPKPCMVPDHTRRGGGRAGSHGSARQYSWPPFVKENTAALAHGAYSERRIQPLAETIMTTARLSPYWPQHLTDPKHESVVEAWGRAEATCQLLRQYLGERDLDAALAGDDGVDPVRPARRYAPGDRTLCALETLSGPKPMLPTFVSYSGSRRLPGPNIVGP
jgi:hypothetical protein